MFRLSETNTIETIKELSGREGGSLHFENKESLNSFNLWVHANTIPYNFKPFVISIYDTDTQLDVVSLVLMINPKDLSIGQTQVVNSAYTRRGYVNTLWGNQQATLSASGLTAGFYYTDKNHMGGLTNFSKKNSLSYLNALSLVSLFKNNGYYFMDGQENPTLFKDGTSNIINVMDTIKISYDGSEYLGSFSSFSLTDVASNPYRMEYVFEFIVSSFGMGLQGIEGHVKRNGNESNSKIVTAIQGANTKFDETIQMNADELNRYFPPDPIPEQQEYLRGGGEYTKRKSNYKYNYKSVNINKYLADNPGVSAKVTKVAGDLGLTPDQLAALIHFESAGTWDPTIGNPYSSALGIGQWTNAAAQSIAKVISKDPYNYIKSSSQIKTSEDLLSYFDTAEKQVELFYIYAKATYVGGTTTLLQAMNRKATPEDRFNTFMIGHFYPAYVNKSMTELLPQNVRDVNPNILTTQDYVDSVRKKIAYAVNNKHTVAKNQ